MSSPYARNISRRRFRGALRAVLLNKSESTQSTFREIPFSLHSNLQGCQTASNASSQVATSERKKNQQRGIQEWMWLPIASVKILFPDSRRRSLTGKGTFLLRLNLYRLCVVAVHTERRMEERQSLNNDEVEFSALIKIE